MGQPVLKPLPTETEILARAAFNPNHPYIRFGSRAENVLASVDLDGLESLENPAGLSPSVLLFVLIFQYIEQLSDLQAVEAMRVRTDWKYALHLPVRFPDIQPAILCQFRSSLLMNAGVQKVLQQVLDCLAEADFFTFNYPQGPRAIDVLQSVCMVDRINRISQTMSAALEAITAQNHGWLRKIILSHWYVRYNSRPIELPENEKDLLCFALSIGQDIRYLLNQVTEAGSSAIRVLPEVQILEAIWRQNFEMNEDEISNGVGFRWRCNRCVNGRG